MIEARVDLYARRAGEEFIAASRAATPDARARHRRAAILFVGLLHEGSRARASARA